MKNISTDLKELFTKEAQNYINESMINDINYVIQNPNAKKLIVEYENKRLEINKIESGGISLTLIVDGKNIDVVNQKGLSEVTHGYK